MFLWHSEVRFFVVHLSGNFGRTKNLQKYEFNELQNIFQLVHLEGALLGICYEELLNVRAVLMLKVMLVAGISLAAFVFAIYEGWSSYELNPYGVFLYTPKDWCTPRTHSFGVTYSFVLLAAMTPAIIVTIIAGTVYLYSKKINIKKRGQFVMQISISLVLVFILLFNISGLFEARLPLQSDPNCKDKPPSPRRAH
jgi:hypothetical protein